MPPAGAIDLFVKHLIAQQAKAFFGYGPKGRAQVYLQGDLALFTSELQGPGLMPALSADPFGRLCMRHINHLYVEATVDQLRRLAADQFGLPRLDVASDVDFDAGLSFGVAIADRALPSAAVEDDAPADLVAAVSNALGFPAEVRLGPSLLVARAVAPTGIAPPTGGDAAADIFAFLRGWADRRDRLCRALRQAAGRPSHGAFAVTAAGRLVIGLLGGQ